MKLWYSFLKELKLAAQSWYFYVEIVMAIIFLLILLFVIPPHYQAIKEEYVYLDLPSEMQNYFHDKSLEEDADGRVDSEVVTIDGTDYQARVYRNDEKDVYYLDSKQAVVDVADKLQKFSAMAELDDHNEIKYTYFLQGYESERFNNLIRVIHNDKASVEVIELEYDAIEVETLSEDAVLLNDRQNSLPLFLTLNGSFMGMFIIAAYIFLDKAEGIIKAFAVTASRVWQYLLSKTGIVLLTSIISSLIIVIPIMKLQPNYLLLILFIIGSGFFATALGLVISTYYRDMMTAMGTMFFIIVLMMLPSFSYMLPSWEPGFIRLLPTYYMLQSFKEILLPAPNVAYVLFNTALFTLLGLVLFAFANWRFKRTLSV